MGAIGTDHEIGSDLLVAQSHRAILSAIDHLGTEAALDLGHTAERIEQATQQIATPEHQHTRNGLRQIEQQTTSVVDDPRRGNALADRLERVREAERIEHGETIFGERDAGTYGARRRDLLDQRDPRARAGEQKRSRHPAGARPNHDDPQRFEIHARTVRAPAQRGDDRRRQRRDRVRQGTIRHMSTRTVLSALVRNVLDAAASLGADAHAIAAEAGLDPGALADPDGRVPVEQDLRVWEILSRRGDGFAIGARLGLASLGIVGYAMAHGATVADALVWQTRYDAIVHPGLVPRIERRHETSHERLVFSRQLVPAYARLREPVYAQITAIRSLLAALSGEAVAIVAVAIPLPPPDDPHIVEAQLSAPVTWNAATLEVQFDAAILDAPLPRAEPRLFGYLSRHADAVLAALPADAGWAERARREIVTLLASGEPRLGAVARRLAVSERTLHRRLAEESTGFATLVDAARQERALRLLEDRALSASEIGLLLGYSEPTAFHRAFRRWTGTTPQAYRRTVTAGPPGREARKCV